MAFSGLASPVHHKGYRRTTPRQAAVNAGRALRRAGSQLPPHELIDTHLMPQGNEDVVFAEADHDVPPSEVAGQETVLNFTM